MLTVQRVEQSQAHRQAGEVSGLGVHSPEAKLGWGCGRGEGERPRGKPQVLEGRRHPAAPASSARPPRGTSSGAASLSPQPASCTLCIEGGAA